MTPTPDDILTPERLARIASDAAVGYPDSHSWVRVTIARLIASHAALRATGTPGVMHAVDRAFYELAIKERNVAQGECARLREALAALATKATGEPQ